MNAPIQTEPIAKLGKVINKRDARKLAHAIAKSEVSQPESERAIYKQLRHEVRNVGR